MPPPTELIALDLDGTLLSPDETVSARNRSAIAAALADGIRVVLVTGRGVDTPIRISRELGLNLPVICCHGALTKDFGADKTLVHIPVPMMMPAAFMMEKVLRHPPVTRDQLKMLAKNNITRTDSVRVAFGFDAQSFADNCGYLQDY